ncbi:uncharacterized protein LY89DRAFT_136225 [Mollisia scopiformis]|uniref:Glycosyltransferase 2-like domain-containing protein n=1 Tax=Mollisia scopiformis TaxID=149040 RepID=A0A194X2E3_MOLSC|nr:uncharacterized protein LY89DRAFT_136225 [Mollisia scopiformis]KUJ14343.1 hypothetical protein LY89DRAFT_136225 [Mollisia scopiformis]
MISLSWCASRCGGISLLSLLALCSWVLFRAAISTTAQPHQDSDNHHMKSRFTTAKYGGTSTHVFAYYSLLVHSLVVAFQFRACRAVWEGTANLQRTKLQKWLTNRHLHRRWKYSASSLSSTDTSSSPSSLSSSEVGDWDSSTETEHELELVIHAILVPNYKEDIEGLIETLQVLASHPQARHTYDVYLAMEQRELTAKAKAAQLVSKFKGCFRFIAATFHPEDIAGESPGKSSNLSWAARAASKRYEIETRRDVVLTSIDADSHLSWRYFSEITSMHFAYSETASTTLYSTPIIFDRNAHLVPGVVRSDVVWSAAGLSGLGSTICPPTSVYSVPLELVDRVGGWDTGPDSIGEDLHMYLKCFFALNGNLTTRSVKSPVSQTNITTSAGQGLLGQLHGVDARYRQALRHMWGSLDSGYALKQAMEVWRRRRQTQQVCQPLHLTTSSKMRSNTSFDWQKEILRSDDSVMRVKIEPPNWFNIFLLFHRLFEAHFMPAHISILVVASTLYRALTPQEEDTFSIAWTFVATDILRAIGLLTLLVFFYSYQQYHHLALEARRNEMIAAGLAEVVSQ